MRRLLPSWIHSTRWHSFNEGTFTATKTTIRIAAALAITLSVTTVAAAGPIDCPARGTIRSKNSNVAATLHIANSSKWPVKIYWLDYKGNRKFYADLPKGADYRQSTYVGHPWIAVNPRGKCVDGVMQATQGGYNIAEIFGD